jgi:hypothetical protein
LVILSSGLPDFFIRYFDPRAASATTAKPGLDTVFGMADVRTRCHFATVANDPKRKSANARARLEDQDIFCLFSLFSNAGGYWPVSLLVADYEKNAVALFCLLPREQRGRG